MVLAKVKGNVISTQKDKHLSGHKLLLTHPVDLNGSFIGDKDIIALDFVDAGIGDTVLVAQEGDAAQQMLGHQNAPVHSVIIAVVDDIEAAEK